MDPDVLLSVANRTTGCVAGDLLSLWREAVILASATMTETIHITTEHFNTAAQTVGTANKFGIPSVVSVAMCVMFQLWIRNELFGLECILRIQDTGEGSLDDVKGMNDVVRVVTIAVRSGLSMSHQHGRKWKLSPPRGLLIHGPSGVGKSALVNGVC